MIPASIRGEYERLASERSAYLTRARDCSKYTIPTLIPPDGKTAASKLRTGYSNFGARCVNSLSSKLLLAMLPARQSFFRLALSEETIRKLDETMRSDIEEGLFKLESIIQSEIDSAPYRTPAGEAIKHLVVAGNVLVYMLPEGGMRVYPLNAFVVQRDPQGNPLTIIAVDRVSPDTLPESVRNTVKDKIKGDQRGNPNRTVEVFTGLFREGPQWKVAQEVKDIRIPEAVGAYPIDACPWMPLRWTPVDGESYGRSMVEDYLGYFISLEGLTAAIVKGSAMAAKVVYLRNPNGITKSQNLTRAETGDVVDGREEDISVLQVQKALDFQTANQMIGDLKEELAYAFAMNQAIQRNAERVTAEEIRYMAQDLDALLGGVYSTLSQEFQLPFLRRLMLQLEKSGKLPALPKKALRPIIVTGLDALGRGAELDNLRAYVADIKDLGGPEALNTFIHFDDLLKRLATARGIRTEGLNKTKEEVAAAVEHQRIQGLIQHLGPNAITQIGQLTKAGMELPTQ